MTQIINKFKKGFTKFSEICDEYLVPFIWAVLIIIAGCMAEVAYQKAIIKQALKEYQKTNH